MSVDRASAHYLSGWCFHRLHTEKPVELECHLKGKLLASTRAEMFREDLRELGIHPTGRCGFEFILKQSASYPPGSALEIRVKGSSTILRQIPTDTFAPAEDSKWIRRIRKLCQPARQERNILFMHIPKTAGTSFNTFALSLFPKGRGISHIELIDRSRYPELQRNFRYISGHLPIGILKTSFQIEATDLYTIIREPYAHLHSHLKWLIHTASNQNDKYFEHSNPAIIELGKTLTSINFNQIGNLKSFIAGMGDLEAAFLDNLQLRYFLDWQPRKTGEADLVNARGNYRLFKTIGTTERYTDFTADFITTHTPGYHGKPFQLNRSRSTPLFNLNAPAVRDALHPLVHLDLQLYADLCKRPLTGS